MSAASPPAPADARRHRAASSTMVALSSFTAAERGVSPPNGDAIGSGVGAPPASSSPSVERTPLRPLSPVGAAAEEESETSEKTWAVEGAARDGASRPRAGVTSSALTGVAALRSTAAVCWLISLSASSWSLKSSACCFISSSFIATRVSLASISSSRSLSTPSC